MLDFYQKRGFNIRYGLKWFNSGLTVVYNSIQLLLNKGSFICLLASLYAQAPVLQVIMQR